MKIIKVLVVDDSAANRSAISGILDSSPYISVVGVAGDGEEAIERVLKLKPDLITLDLEMPRMDGFTFLRWLMKSFPLPVLVISSRDDDKSVIRALEFGAVDFLPRPVTPGAVGSLALDLVEKVKLCAPLEMANVRSSVALLDRVVRENAASSAHPAAACHGRSAYDVVAIGSSTGGPPALQSIITRLPNDFGAAVAVSQHMPPKFTKFFAERLDKLAHVEVKEAEDGDLVIPARVLIAPGGHHLSFERGQEGVVAVVRKASAGDKYVPSVDRMMKSAAVTFGRRALGVILTGMGNDGREGMVTIKAMGGATLAESKETAVIYGMPREAVDAGAVDRIVMLGDMADEIMNGCGRPRR